VKVVFDNLANYLSISPNQPQFLQSVCLVPASALPVSSHPVLSPIYSVQCTCSHTHMYSTVCDQLCCEYMAIEIDTIE
jgi:hypothetical protein